MNSVRGAMSLFPLLISLALPCIAGEMDETPEEEVLSPRERAELELKRRRGAEPVLAVEPADLALELEPGGSGELRLTIRNAGGRKLEWSVSAAPGWLGVSPKRGELGFEEEREIALTLSAAELEAGMTDDKLVFRAPGAKGSPFAVSVRLTIKPGQDEKEDEIARAPADEAPAEPGPEAPDVPATGKRYGLGVRGSVLLPGSARREDYVRGLAVGILWRQTLGASRLGYEVEVAFGGMKSQSGLESSDLVVGRVWAVIRLLRRNSYAVYALGGMSLVSEEAEDTELGRTSIIGSTVDFGAGTTFGGRFDARVTYSVLVGSENVGGIVAASVGVMF